MPHEFSRPSKTRGARPMPTQSPRLRVLVVEDQHDSALLLANLLQLVGHEVSVAFDGPEGLRIAREEQPDAVLLDIGLPHLDGYQVAERLREDEARGEA